jgi:tetratricopeptide (TPR) repeat protein
MANNFLSRLLKKPNLLQQSDLEQYEESIVKLQDIEKSFNQGSIESALDNIENYFKVVSNVDNPIPLLIFDTLTLYIKFLIYKTKFNLIQDLINQNKQLIDLVGSSKDKIIMKKFFQFKLLESSYYIRRGNYNEVNKITNLIKDLPKVLEDKNVSFQYNNHLAILSLINYDIKQSLNLLLPLLEENKIGSNEITLNNNIGLAYLYSGELKKAFTHLNKAQEIAKGSNQKILESLVKSNISLYNLFSGNIQEASTLLEENLQFFQQIDFNFELANTYINLSSLSEIKGEIVQSQSDLTSAIDISRNINNDHLKFICNNNFANLSFITGEFELAKNSYLESYDYFNSHNLPLDSINTIFNLLSLAVLENDTESKTKYLAIITKIKNSMENQLIDLIFQISRGLDLKQYDRMVKKAEAQQIFTNIANNDTIINHEFRVIALKNLCELLIEELSSSGDQEVIDELKIVLQQILAIAEKQNSIILRVESFLIQSKVDLLEFKLNEARTLLGQAQTIAEEKGLTALAIFSSRQYDNLLNQIGKLQDQGDLNLSNLSMNERLELAELENMVNKIIRKRAEIPDITEEKPFMFLIIAISGMSLFSKIFVDEDLMDEQLIGGFITAINIVTQQAFSDQDAIEGIRHQDFTLLLKYLGSTRILCVYVFKGQTYFAMQKLKTFIETVQYSDAMSIIDDANDIGKIISEEPPLLNLVTKIFEESDENSLELAKRNFFSQKISSTINHGLIIDDISLFT